jgi:hypothetical protein
MLGWLTAVFVTVIVCVAEVASSVQVGAIRWDAWYGAEDDVGAYVQSALSPQVSDRVADVMSCIVPLLVCLFNACDGGSGVGHQWCEAGQRLLHLS